MGEVPTLSLDIRPLGVAIMRSGAWSGGTAAEETASALSNGSPVSVSTNDCATSNTWAQSAVLGQRTRVDVALRANTRFLVRGNSHSKCECSNSRVCVCVCVCMCVFACVCECV
jgi:hypothetical protein